MIGTRYMMSAVDIESNHTLASETDRKMQQERTLSPTSVTRYAECSGRKMHYVGAERTHFDGETSTEQNLDSLETTFSVRFERSVTIRFTRSRRDYTPRQLKDCWYQPSELQDIRSSCSEDIRKTEDLREQQREDTTDDTCCVRGLESHDELAHKQKFRLRAEAAGTVFNAEEHGCNEKQIASRYSEVTARSQTWANVLGLRDQREANSIHDESRKPILFF